MQCSTLDDGRQAVRQLAFLLRTRFGVGRSGTHTAGFVLWGRTSRDTGVRGGLPVKSHSNDVCRQNRLCADLR